MKKDLTSQGFLVPIFISRSPTGKTEAGYGCHSQVVKGSEQSLKK